MITVNRILYMPGRIGNQGGYQVVAMTEGANDEDVNFINDYGIPVAVKPTDFAEGMRLISLPSGRVGLNVLYNIGRAYDGRLGAIYSETFVIGRDEFEKNRADPYLLLDSFPNREKAISTAKELAVSKKPRILQEDKVQIPRAKSIDFQSITRVIPDAVVLRNVLAALMEKKKRIILKVPNEVDQKMREDFVRNLVLLFPLKMRIIPYTTYACEPGREDPFWLMMVVEGKFESPSSPARFETIETNEIAKEVNEPGQIGVADYLTGIARAGDEKAHDELIRVYFDYVHERRDSPSDSPESSLEFAFKWRILFKDKSLSDDERFELGLDLIRQAPEKLRDEVLNDVRLLIASNPGRVVKFGKTCLQVFRNKSDLYKAYFISALRDLLEFGGSSETGRFVRDALAEAAEGWKADLLGETISLLSKSKAVSTQEDLVELILDSERVDAFLTALKSERRYETAPLVCALLRDRSDQAAAIGLVEWIYREAVTENPTVVAEALASQAGGAASVESELWFVGELMSRLGKDLATTSDRKPLLLVVGGGTLLGYFLVYSGSYINVGQVIEILWLSILGASTIGYVYGTKAMLFPNDSAKNRKADSSPYASEVLKEVSKYMNSIRATLRESGSGQRRVKVNSILAQLSKLSSES